MAGSRFSAAHGPGGAGWRWPPHRGSSVRWSVPRHRRNEFPETLEALTDRMCEQIPFLFQQVSQLKLVFPPPLGRLGSQRAQIPPSILYVRNVSALKCRNVISGSLTCTPMGTRTGHQWRPAQVTHGDARRSPMETCTGH